MDTALPQKCSFVLGKNLAKANCTGNRVCTSCDIVVLDLRIKKESLNSTIIIFLGDRIVVYTLLAVSCSHIQAEYYCVS